jgi:hypothetical protein
MIARFVRTPQTDNAVRIGCTAAVAVSLLLVYLGRESGAWGPPQPCKPWKAPGVRFSPDPCQRV